jgi:hypothetical protein
MKIADLRWMACVALLCAACGNDTEDDDASTDEGRGEDRDSGRPPSENPDGGGAPADAGTGDAGMQHENPTFPSAKGLCDDLETDFEGDDACLKAPDPDVGFQIHIGPSDYDDPAQVEPFIMMPGDESSQCYLKKVPLDHDAHYMVFELSGRPGTHHIINTLRTDDLPEGFGSCGDQQNSGGTIGGASKPHMPPIPVAPENEGLGVPVKAHQQAQHDMHYFNFTDQPILREFWMNLYFVPEDEVTQVPSRIGGLGGFGWTRNPIQPGTHQVYPFECPISTDGRIISLLGHTHSHALRETAYIRRAGGQREKVFEQYDYLEPQVFTFDSLTENPGFSDDAPGAHTGMLEVFAGDVLEWECEVKNDSEVPLRYTNAVQTGEMCNIWGMSIGPQISCYLP